MQGKTIAALTIITGLLLAGCLDGSERDSNDSKAPPSSTGLSESPPSGSPGPINSPTPHPFTVRAWTGQSCLQLATPFYGTSNYVDANLPAAYASSAGATAALFLVVVDCPAVSIGNATLVEPFQLAAVYAFVQKHDENSSRQEIYVFESMLNNATLVDAATSHGWPAQLGHVTRTEGPSHEVLVQAEAMDYTLTIVSLPGSSGALDRHETMWHVADEPDPYLLVDLIQTMDDGLADPSAVQANEGTLSEAFAAGAYPGIPEQVTMNFRLDFPRSDNIVA